MKTMKTCKYGCGKMATGGVAKMKKVKKMADGGQIYGIPQTGTTNYSAPTMKKGGMVKKQNDGKTGAQLKAEGMAMKKKGQALKAKGQAMKAVGSIKPKTGMDGVNALAYHIKKGGVYKKGGSVKKMQGGGKVVKTKSKTAVPASWRTVDAVKGGYWDSSTPEIGQSETFGNTTVKKNAIGRTTLKTPYTETAPSGKKSVGTITDKFNRKGQLTKTVTKSNVTSPTGAQYKSKDVNKVSTKTYKKGGSTFGMLSVKAGIDNNPGKTAADRIAGAKMKMRKKK
jgi:hypothetical protein